VDQQTRLQARYDLGLDYRMAGIFDRAVSAFEEILAEHPSHEDSLRQLIQIYEDTKDWEPAFEASQKLTKITGKEPRNAMAHYQVEMGKVHFGQGALARARECYQKAISLDPRCVDAYLHLGDLYLKDKKPEKAVATWRDTVNVAPVMSFLVFGRLARVYNEFSDLELVEDFLNECAAKERDPLARLALSQILLEVGDREGALGELRKSLELDPGLLEAHRELGFILIDSNLTEEILSAYHDLLNHLTSPGADFLCEKCGFVSNELMWRCTQCQEWDTMRLHRRRPILLALGKTDVAESSDPEELDVEWS
jgi:lipopolysaccharide biosynthesis regulator YciM